jgi:hypothetical protein
MRKWWNKKVGGGDHRRITWGSVCLALLFIAVGFGVAAALLATVTGALTFRVDSAWEAYAGLIILAFAIERIVQPFSDALGPVPDNKTKAKVAKANTAVVTWGFATALGMIASAALKAGALTAVAASGFVPNRWLDVVVTGLVLGAGTKPIHDMLSQVQATKEKKEADATAKTTAAPEADDKKVLLEIDVNVDGKRHGAGQRAA